MVVRILTLLVAVMLLASPRAEACAEIDAQYEALALDDQACVQVAVALRTPRTAYVTLLRHDEPVPVAPVLGRIFRPPRTAVA